MVSMFKISKANLSTIWVSFGILMPCTLLFAQEEIDEPAGEIPAVIEDSEPVGEPGDSVGTVEGDAGESQPMDVQQTD